MDFNYFDEIKRLRLIATVNSTQEAQKAEIFCLLRGNLAFILSKINSATARIA